MLEINEFRSHRIYGLRFELLGIGTLLTGMRCMDGFIAWLRHLFLVIASKGFLHHERVIIEIGTRHSDDVIMSHAVDTFGLTEHVLPTKSMRESINHGGAAPADSLQAQQLLSLE